METLRWGFSDLGRDGLIRVIAAYRRGLNSDANYPCGGTRRQVKHWLKLAEAELAKLTEKGE